MTDSQQEKIQKLHENRLKAQTELINLQQKILDSITNGDRRVRVECPVKETDDAMTKAFTRKEQLITLATETFDSGTNHSSRLGKMVDRSHWSNWPYVEKSLQYMDSCTGSEVKSHSLVATVNKSASKRSSTSVKTKTSDQRQNDLVLATRRWKELHRQNPNAVRLDKQKQETARKQLEREKSGLRRTSSPFTRTGRRKQTKICRSQSH